MSKYKVADLFCGAGSMSLAFIGAGFEIVWANESNRYYCMTYIENFGGHYIEMNNVSDINAGNIPDFDVLAVTLLYDTEEELFISFDKILEILYTKNPKALLIEGKKDLVKLNKNFNKIYNELIEYNYKIKYKVMNMYEYGNIPLDKNSAYIVGFSNSLAYDNFEFPDKIELTTTLNSIINRSIKQSKRFYFTEKSSNYEKLKNSVVKKDTVYIPGFYQIRENKNNLCSNIVRSKKTSGKRPPIILDDYGIRNLTPTEYFKLHGYPSDFVILRNISDRNLYSQAENSIAIPVVKRIAINIRNALEVL